jgi:hypothetical protein
MAADTVIAAVERPGQTSPCAGLESNNSSDEHQRVTTPLKKSFMPALFQPTPTVGPVRSA